MIQFRSKKKETVGLDIGAHSVKMVSLEKSSEANTVKAYNIKDIPFGAETAEKRILIEEVFSELDIHPETVNLSISGADVIVRFITLPKMTKEQLEGALVFEAEKYIPFNINEVVIDSVILGDASDPGQMNVLLAAAKREAVESLLRMVSNLGMSVDIIDTNHFAMFNAFIKSKQSLRGKGTVLLDFGHTETQVLIAVGDIPCFTRQVQIGGRDMIKAMCENLSILPKEFEKYKMAVGNDEEKNANMIQAAEKVLDDLITEIQLSFGYFENRHEEAISDIYCSGGMVYQKGFLELLNKKLGVPVKTWNALDSMKISENLSIQDINSVSSRLVVCIGLALRG